MSETMSLLHEDLAAVAEHHNPQREGVLQLVLEAHAEHFGPGVPVNLRWLNKLLAQYGQPLTNQAEMSVWYGQKPPVGAVT